MADEGASSGETQALEAGAASVAPAQPASGELPGLDLVSSLTVEHWIFVVAVFLFSIFITYKEIDVSFAQKKIRIARVFKHLPSIGFLALNAIIASVLLAWSYSSAEAGINTLIPEPLRSPFWSAVFIGFGLPMLLKSRITEIGEEQKKILAGLDELYGWAKSKILASFEK